MPFSILTCETCAHPLLRGREAHREVLGECADHGERREGWPGARGGVAGGERPAQRAGASGHVEVAGLAHLMEEASLQLAPRELGGGPDGAGQGRDFTSFSDRHCIYKSA